MATKLVDLFYQDQSRSFLGDEIGPNFIGDQYQRLYNNKYPTIGDILNGLYMMLDQYLERGLNNLNKEIVPQIASFLSKVNIKKGELRNSIQEQKKSYLNASNSMGKM